jgi:hypothetical protein
MSYLEEASSWKSDAYLAWIDILIRSEYPASYRVIVAPFNSPGAEYENLLVDLGADDTVTHEIVEHEVPVYQQNPMPLDNWKIDSQESLEIMLNQDGVDFITNKGAEQCVSLYWSGFVIRQNNHWYGD